MKTFVCVIVVIALIEVGGAISYLVTGVVPARTMLGVKVNLFSWGAFAAWGAFLLWKGGAA